ncbi:hypothetical protein GCM10023149_48580 [Mucilaginibacter gynuensis]|uniref:Uncharacterized protein n=1 Tax=Mucilaginibacter gynuensis TaxID=1302236 RepID=A0ABP8HF87_9SPHI
MTEKDIQQLVRHHFGNYDYQLFNSFMFSWESDFFAISKSKYAVEVEIKISRADFKCDFKHKTEKHELLKKHNQPLTVERGYVDHLFWGKDIARYVDENGRIQYARGSTIHIGRPADKIPNKFYYCVPEGLITPAEVPAYAGLLYAVKDQFSNNLREVKKAPFLHKQTNDFARSLLKKYYNKHLYVGGEVRVFLNEIEHLLNDYQKDRKRQLMNKLR